MPLLKSSWKGKTMITAKVNRSTNLFINIGCTLACLALLPVALAVSPPPDGGYPGSNTAEGDFALFSLTDGTDNTAAGYGALFNNTTGGANTASGSNALYSNTTGAFNTATGQAALYSNTTGTFNTADGSCGAFQQHHRQRQHSQRF
jgi:hypothetical protein